MNKLVLPVMFWLMICWTFLFNADAVESLTLVESVLWLFLWCWTSAYIAWNLTQERRVEP